MEYEPGANTSWAWRKICQVKNIYKQFLFNEDGTSKSSFYSVKEGYNWINGDTELKDWWPWMNNRWITPKHRFIIWAMAHQRLLTRARMKHLNMTSTETCFICDEGQETINHLFFCCRYSYSIIETLREWCGIKLPTDACIEWWLLYRDRSATKQKILVVLLATSIYVLWNVRNKAKMDLIVMHPNNVIKRIKSDVIRRIESLDLKTNCTSTRGWIERLKLGGTG